MPETKNPLIGRKVYLYRSDDSGGDHYKVYVHDIRDGLIFSDAKDEKGRPLVITVASCRSIAILDGSYCIPTEVSAQSRPSTENTRKKNW